MFTDTVAREHIGNWPGRTAVDRVGFDLAARSRRRGQPEQLEVGHATNAEVGVRL